MNIYSRHFPGGLDLAKAIELGLTLEGEDAVAFRKYLQHPDDTEDGRKLLLKAARIAKTEPLE